MIETDLKKLNWNPDTCECKLGLTREETKIVGHEEFALDRRSELLGVRAYAERNDSGEMVYKVPIHETTKVDIDGAEISRVKTPALEKPPPPGIRLRATVTKPCPDHVGFTGVVQTQRVSCPLVCKCVWQELIKGERKELGFFGAVVERVCDGHLDVPLAEIRNTVQAAARALPDLEEG